MLLLTLNALVPSHSGSSQTTTTVAVRWNQTAGFPVDGVFWSIAVEPGNSNRLYAGIENLGFMLSRDGGITWERHDPGHHFNRGILLDRINSSLLYYIYGGGLVVINKNTGAELKTTGFGTSPGYANNNRAESIVEDPSGKLYIGTPFGVFKSSDQGTTVQQIGQSLPTATTYSALALDPSNPGVIYVGTRGPWYYDSILVSSVPAGYVGKGLYRSTDAGSTWQLLGSTYLPAGLNINSVVVNPSDRNMIYIATSQGIYKSIDSGNSWISINNGLLNRSVWTLILNPTNPSQLFAGTWGGGLFVTSDGGGTWAKSGFNGIDFHRDRIFSLAFDPNSYTTLYVGTGNGLFRYNIQTTAYSHLAATVFHSAAADLAIDPVNSSIVYSLEGGSGGGRDLYRSTNGGTSWEFIGPFQPLENTRNTNCLFGLNCPPYSIDHTYGMDVAINSSNTSIVYYSSAYGLYVSHDGGSDWSLVHTGVLDDQFHIHGIAIYPKYPNIVYLSTGGGVASNFIFTHMLKSVDGGRTWILIDSGLPRQNYHMMKVLVDPNNPNVVYMASTTMGFGCQPAHHPLPLCVAVGIYKTADGGNSWFAVNNGLATLDVPALAFDPLNSSVLYAGAGDSLYSSKDAGASWKKILSLGDGIVVSAVAVDPNMPNLMFVGTMGGAGVYVSPDGGNSWMPADSGFADQFGVPDVQDLQISPRGGTIFATAGGVFKANYSLVTVTTTTATLTSATTATSTATATSAVTSTPTVTSTATSTVTSTLSPVTTTITGPTSTTASQASATTGNGGIPEFPYQLVAVTIFTALLAASYLLVRRYRPQQRPTPRTQ